MKDTKLSPTMDFKTIGSALLDSFAQQKAVENFGKRHPNIPEMERRLRLPSTSRETYNVIYSDPEMKPNEKEETFDVYVESLELSPIAVKFLNSKHNMCLGIRICWHFMNFESTTAIIQAKEGSIRINEMKSYPVRVNETLLNYFSKRDVKFEIYGAYEKSEIYFAKCEADLKDVLAKPDKDVTKYASVVAADKLKMFRKMSKSDRLLGKLKIQFVLRPNEIAKNLPEKPGEVQELYYKADLNSEQSFQEILEDKHDFATDVENTDISGATLGFTPSYSEYIHEGLQLVITSDVFQESIQSKTQLTPLEYNTKRTLQEYAILRGAKLSEVNLDKLEKEVGVIPRQYVNEIIGDPIITINVVSVELNERGLLAFAEAHLYVEYSFLSRCGEDMESRSFPLLPDHVITYNFKKSFKVDLPVDRNDCMRLANMIRNNESIKFLVIEEPAFEINKFQICQEIAFAEVNLFNLVQAEENDETGVYTLHEIDNPTRELGCMTISFHGIQIMRNVALSVLSPSDYLRLNALS